MSGTYYLHCDLEFNYLCFLMLHFYSTTFSFWFNIYCIFSPLPFSPLIPPSFQQSTHHCLCPWVLFPFLLKPSAPYAHPPHLSYHLLSICESVPVFLISSGWSLDYTYKWNHMVFVFPWLACYFFCWTIGSDTLLRTLC